jgi:NAD(P)-dependent dehydrogenase (short-subunit alcohol dehydrogenase family)
LGEILAQRFVCDVGRGTDVLDAVGKTVATFGGLHILINNAQGFGTESKPRAFVFSAPLEELDEEEWEYTFRTGALATVRAMKAAFPYLRKSGCGRIINMGSSSALVGTAGLVSYNANKEAIRGITRTAAREWGRHGITANVLCPMMETDSMSQWKTKNPADVAMIDANVPLGRLGNALTDLAPLAVFLAGDGGGYLTGMIFMVDGGLYAFA